MVAKRFRGRNEKGISLLKVKDVVSSTKLRSLDRLSRMRSSSTPRLSEQREYETDEVESEVDKRCGQGLENRGVATARNLLGGKRGGLGRGLGWKRGPGEEPVGVWERSPQKPETDTEYSTEQNA